MSEERNLPGKKLVTAVGDKVEEEVTQAVHTGAKSPSRPKQGSCDQEHN